jgi:hypothetical protein
LAGDPAAGKVVAEAIDPMASEIRALRRRIEQTGRNARGHRRYGKKLRADVVAYAQRREEEAGLSQAAVARELGLSQKALWSWVRSFRQIAMKPVEIVDDRPVEAKPKRTLVLPGGARVEGLEVDDVIALVKGLS